MHENNGGVRLERTSTCERRRREFLQMDRPRRTLQKTSTMPYIKRHLLIRISGELVSLQSIQRGQDGIREKLEAVAHQCLAPRGRRMSLPAVICSFQS